MERDRGQGLRGRLAAGTKKDLPLVLQAVERPLLGRKARVVQGIEDRILGRLLFAGPVLERLYRLLADHLLDFQQHRGLRVQFLQQPRWDAFGDGEHGREVSQQCSVSRGVQNRVLPADLEVVFIEVVVARPVRVVGDDVHRQGRIGRVQPNHGARLAGVLEALRELVHLFLDDGFQAHNGLLREVLVQHAAAQAVVVVVDRGDHRQRGSEMRDEADILFTLSRARGVDLVVEVRVLDMQLVRGDPYNWACDSRQD